MPNTSQPIVKTLLIIGAIVLFFLAGRWFNPNWGRLELGQPATLTVTADGTQTNQIATFYAGVVANNPDRDAAVSTVNEQMAELIRQVKEFGIPDEDIKTENITVYEYTESPPYILMEESAAEPAIFPPPPARKGEKVWQASNNITITLRDVSRATALATLITNTGATTVSGPNFTIDDSTVLDRQLLQQAMQDAREKAELLLAGTGQRITRIITIYENEAYTPYPLSAQSRATDASETAVPVEPGSQTITKSITVIFEISR